MDRHDLRNMPERRGLSVFRGANAEADSRQVINHRAVNTAGNDAA